MNSRAIPWIGLSVLAVMLVGGFLAVMDRRFAEGGVYPHYASYRSDPLGTSALYEALETLGGVEPRRNIQHLNRVEGLDFDTAILLLGYPRTAFSRLRAPDDSAVMKAVEEGARLVVTVNPGLVPEKFEPALSDEEKDWFERREEMRKERTASRAKEKAEEEKNGSEPGEESKDGGDDASEEAETGSDEARTDDTDDESEGENESEEEEDEFEEWESRMASTIGPQLTDKLEFEIYIAEEFEHVDGGWEVLPGETIEGPMTAALPSWHSQLRFDELGEVWEKVALVGEEPVVIERRYGEGSVVLVSDSFFVSNEALHLEPRPEFLSWLLGGRKKVVFDETVHGSQETGGAMKLIRRYRLHGVFLGMLLFVALWAWRTASPLAPGSENLDRGLVGPGGTVAGEEAGSGFVRLLRWSIPRAELIDRCLSEWKLSAVRKVGAENEKAVDALTARHREDPKRHDVVATYREISEILRKR